MKRHICKSFLLIICGILFSASNVIGMMQKPQPTLALVAKMPKQISAEITGVGIKGAGTGVHIKNIINQLYPNCTIKTEPVPHVTFAIIGQLNTNTKIVTDTKGNTFKLQYIKKAIKDSIEYYKKGQKNNYKYDFKQHKYTKIKLSKSVVAPIFLKMDDGVEFLYPGKPNVTRGATSVAVVQKLSSQKAKGKLPKKLLILADILRSNLKNTKGYNPQKLPIIGVQFRYGFKPHVTMVTVSSNTFKIEKMKKAELIQKNPLAKAFGKVLSTTDKANKRGYKYKSLKIDEILLSSDRFMKTIEKTYKL